MRNLQQLGKLQRKVLKLEKQPLFISRPSFHTWETKSIHETWALETVAVGMDSKPAGALNSVLSWFNVVI